MIIVLGGPAGVGKDTVGMIIAEEFGFVPRAYADPLRDFLMAQNPWVKMDSDNKWARLNQVIERYGWQGYKSSPFALEMRSLIQKTGTEAGRNVIGKDVWVNNILFNLPKGDVVITDARFANELEIITGPGRGKAIKVTGPSRLPTKVVAHSSEEGLPDYMFDAFIHNTGTIIDLRESVIETVSSLIN